MAVSEDPIVINPCFGKRYSGVNASLIAVFPHLNRLIPMAAIGLHMPDSIPRIGLAELLRYKGWRIWHARRNIEMLAGILLRKVLGLRLLLVFTSAAQRPHTWITRSYIKMMDAVIAPTRKAASFLDRPAAIVAHGVDTERFYPPADRRAQWHKTGLPGRFGIGTFGRIRPQKGTEDLVDALIKVLPDRPDWTAVIIGQVTAEYRSFQGLLIQKVRKAGLQDRIRFIGFIKDPMEIPEWYRALSLVVCPSRVEGFGLPCLEAMASGCPVVATRTGAWPEIIDNHTDGLLAPCRDPAALADAIASMTADPALLAKMGQRARQKVLQRYSIINEARGIFAVYKALMSGVGMGF